MWDFVDRYISAHPAVAKTVEHNEWQIASENTRNVTPVPLYYNNFEVHSIQERP